jgi:hypothetical protein
MEDGTERSPKAGGHMEKISHDLVEIFFDGHEDPSILLSR